MNDLILFDGVCNFCSASVNFVIKNDSQNRYQFASLQSDYGQALLTQHHLNNYDLNTVFLISNGKLYSKSEAVLQIARHLRGWSWIAWFRWVPLFIRNTLYDLVARNRYRIFGKANTCHIPTAAQKNRFIGNL
jgi:predicted DCC family thiol-disulfide oxidoreductase YuxK